MRKHYDFSSAQKNPYAKQLKRPVTIRLDDSTVAYFKKLAEKTELPYQSLINLYLAALAETPCFCSSTVRESLIPKRATPELLESRWGAG